MRVLENIKPERVFYFFEEISKIPRGSGNTDAISEYCVDFANKHNLSVNKDEVNNVIIKKAASIGREADAGIILQGHMDMVCEKVNDSLHDFINDGIELMIEGDFVTAKGTTLGADDGIAVAMALAILEDDTLSHPALEVIFTIDEETGMDGAKYIDLSDIQGKYVLNLDCDIDGVAFAGCAGGIRIDLNFEFNTVNTNKETYMITVNGLKGGHSGSEIDKERANSNMLIGRILGKLHNCMDFDLIAINGGTKDNVITRETNCIVATDDYDCLFKKINEIMLDLSNEYVVTDPSIQINIEKYNIDGEILAINEETKKNIIMFLNTVPYGPQNYSMDIKGLVETSLNLGIIETLENSLKMGISVRSTVRSRKYLVVEKIKYLASLTNALFNIHGDYPEWEFNRNSKLQEIIVKEYKELFGQEMKIDMIHAGLECGYLLDKKKDLDILSFGPQMYDIHTPEERLSISSTAKVYRLVTRLLEII